MVLGGFRSFHVLVPAKNGLLSGRIRFHARKQN